MVRTQVYLPEDVYEDLKLIAKSGKLNFSQLIREGAQKVIRKRTETKKRNWKKFAGALKAGPKDLSNRINEIYK